jgi:hypothetical protein
MKKSKVSQYSDRTFHYKRYRWKTTWAKVQKMYASKSAGLPNTQPKRKERRTKIESQEKWTALLGR